MKKTRLLIIIGLLVLLAGAVSCGKDGPNPKKSQKVIVVATLFPLYDFAKTIAADRAEVTLLLPPGVEAHAFEPKPGDMVRINTAQLFIYTGKYMEPWAESLIKGVENKKLVVVDASRGIRLMENHDKNHEHAEKKEAGKEEQRDHGTYDPHIWLDLENAVKMVDNIADGLSEIDPANRELYRKNAEAYRDKLTALDRKFREELGACKKKTIVHGGHFAFGYLANRYGLEYVSAYEGSPNSEPTAKKIIALKKKIREKDVRYVYFEELITPRISELLSKETGATLLQLHGAHNISKDEFGKGAGFISLMEGNLTNLKVGLECR